MSISSYNKFSKKFNAEISKLSFVKLADLYNQSPDKEYVLTGLFINTKSKFGDRPYVSTPDFLADLPMQMLPTIKDMMNDNELVKHVESFNSEIAPSISNYYSSSNLLPFVRFVEYLVQISPPSEGDFTNSSIQLKVFKPFIESYKLFKLCVTLNHSSS